MLLPALFLIATMGGPGPRKLVMDDDFSKLTSLPSSQFSYDTGPVYNHELEKYTGAGEGNVFVKGGALVIKAMKRDGQITSGRVTSIASWRYPYVEVVAKVPDGAGTWPAIWMLGESLRTTDPAKKLGWPQCGEIDIMENVGSKPDEFRASLHSGKYNWMHGNQRTKVISIANGPAHYHTFGMDSRPNHIDFLIDGKVYYSVTNTESSNDAWPFNSPMYLILNLAIGGDLGGPVASGTLPAEFKIKSVKVWASK